MSESEKTFTMDRSIGEKRRVAVSSGDPVVPNADAQAGPQVRHGGVRTKLTTDENGNMVVTTETASRGQASQVSRTSADPLDSADVPRARLSDDSIIRGEAIGGSMQLRQALDLGWVKRTADGYVFLGVDGKFQQTQGQATTPQNQQQDAQPTPGDVRGVPPTPPSVDTFQAALASKTPMALDGLTTSVAQTGTIPESLVEDMARQHGADPVAFRGQVDEMISAYVESGRAAVRNAGVESGSEEAFETWARENHKDAFDTAVRELVNGKSVGKLQDLGRSFSLQSANKLAAIINARGADARVDADRNVMITRASLGLDNIGSGTFVKTENRLRDAIRQGHIIIE